MTSPRVFVSSTCYDLSILRAQLKRFIESYGFTPVLSEFSDVLYDPRLHTHVSCVREARNSDLAIFVVGSRFGGDAVPEALAEIPAEVLQSMDHDSLPDTERCLSVTQVEVLACLDAELPVFAFVDEGVMNDYHVYEGNRTKEFLSSIEFPHISQKESAPYIFEFLGYLRNRSSGSALQPFRTSEDIERHLKLQWSAYFQRLLSEDRRRSVRDSRLEALSEEVTELRTAFLTTIEDGRSRNIARGAIRYRGLLTFYSGLPGLQHREVIRESIIWSEVLERAGVLEIELRDDEGGWRGETRVNFKNGLTLRSRVSPPVIHDRYALEWEQLLELEPDDRVVIFDAVTEDPRHNLPLLRPLPSGQPGSMQGSKEIHREYVVKSRTD